MHAAPMYIAETAPTPIRGILISLKEFFIVLGMVVSSWAFWEDLAFSCVFYNCKEANKLLEIVSFIAFSEIFFYQIIFYSECPGITKNGYISFVQAGYGVGSLLVGTVAGWRYMFGVSSPLAIIMGIGMWFLPDSPRWLLLCAIQGKGDIQNLKETAICCLCQLRGQAIGDSAPQQVDEILLELSYVGEEKKVTFGEMFRGKCKKALVIGAGLVLFQQVLQVKKLNLSELPTFQCIYPIGCFLQITGQPSVLYYAGSILQVLCLIKE